MGNQFAKLLVISVLCMSLLMGGVVPVQAQEIVPTLPPAAAAALPQPQAAPLDPDVVTFEQLRRGETQLIGPFDSTSFSFALPANWEVKTGAKLNLSMGVSFNSFTVMEETEVVRVGGGGTLSVLMNGMLISAIPLNELGEIERVLEIPVEAFKSNRSDGRMELTLNLDSEFACYINDGNNQMSVFLHPKSFFTLPHNFIQPGTSLVNFPRPIIQNSFIPDTALLVIPEQPTIGELQAALTVGASLGKLSRNALVMDLTTPSKLTTELASGSNLIFVGNAASLPMLSDLKLPEPVNGGQFQIAGSGPDDGVVQLVNSPWSNGNVVLVVSGNTDQGTIKAAQAVGSGVLLTSSKNTVVVQNVQTASVSKDLPVDQTLVELGGGGRLFENRGVDTAPYTFYVPPGMTVTSDAHFLLLYGHSSLVDFERSGLSVLLNNTPIGSIRLTELTVGQTTNELQIDIPASAIVPGNNLLEIKANLVPIDNCTSPNLAGLWINIWPESTLHLPLAPVTVDPVAEMDLADYSDPFIYDPLLGNTAFVVARNDLESWRGALQVASYLGTRANGVISALTAYYGDDLPEADRQKYNMVIVGSPSQLPIVQEINNTLPVPFLDGGDVAGESNFQVTYRIPPDSPQGYVEMMTSPWNPSNVVLAVLGNKAQGVNWAISSLIVPTLRSGLAGNFAMINNQQILTSDTRIAQTVNTGSTQNSGIVAVQPTTEAMPPVVEETPWVFPAFVISLVLILIMLVVMVVRNVARNRARNKLEKKLHKSGGSGSLRSLMNRFMTFLKGLFSRKDG